MKERLFYILFFISTGLFAQSLEYVNYDIDDGLPSNEVYDVLEDYQGYMWFATDRGIVRYNGYEFKTYTTQEGLSGNVNFNLIQDAQNNLWTIGYGNSVSVKYAGTDVFISKAILISGHSKGSQKFTKNLVWVRDSSICFRTIYTQYTYTLENDTFRLDSSQNYIHFPSFNGVKYHNDTLLSYMSNEWPPEEKSIRKGSGVKIINISFPELDLALLVAGNKPNGHSFKANFIYYPIDDDSALIIYLHSIFYVSKKQINFLGKFGVVNFVFVANNGKVSIGTFTGLYEFENGLDKPPIKNPFFKDMNVTSILENNNGERWVCTIQQGVFYSKNLKIKHHLDFNASSENNIQELFCQQNTSGTNEIVVIYNHSDIVSFYGREKGVINVDIGFKTEEINRFVPIDAHHLLFGSSTAELTILKNKEVVFDATKIAIPQYYDTKTKTFWKSGNVVCGTWKDSSFVVKDDVVAGSRVSALLQMNGRLYSGGNGVFGYCIPPDTGFYNVKIDGISSNFRVTDLSKIDENNLVGATLGQGVFIMDTNEVFRWITAENGLVSNLVGDVFVNSDGDIWAATNGGVSWLRLEKGYLVDVVNFTDNNGLLSNQVASITQLDDEMWIGTAKGISIINLCDYSENRMAIPLYVLSASNQEGELDFNEGVELSYLDNLKIEFVGLDFKSEGDVLYQYRLKGYDNQWYTTNSRFVQYSKLTNGDYEFELKLSEGDKNISIRHLKVIVLSPFWKTWWFAALVLLTVVLLIKWRVDQIRKIANQKMHLAEVKQQALASQMNPHFLFNSFNSVRNFILNNDKALADRYIVKISELVRSVLNNSFKSTVSLKEEVQLLQNYLEIEMLRTSGKFTYEFKIDREVNLDKVQIPPSVLQPFVENAIWHGLKQLKQRKGEIVVRINQHNKCLCVEIEDNGVGFVPGDIKKSKSYGLKITKERLNLLKDLYGQKVSVAIEPIQKKGHLVGTLVKVEIYN